MIENASDRDVLDAERRQVELLYSKKLRRIVLADRAYAIPANYFGPKHLNEPNELLAQNSGFGFSLFLPDYGGYTMDNWQDPFDRRRIDVVQVSNVNRNAQIRQRDGTYRRIAPSAYGDASARFSNRRSGLEDAPSFHMYGLEGYRTKGRSEIVWTGRRTNGEFVFFECAVPQNELGRSSAVVVNPTCQTQYYSEAADLHVVYRYSQNHLPQWREIDDAIWAKLHAWREHKSAIER